VENSYFGKGDIDMMLFSKKRIGFEVDLTLYYGCLNLEKATNKKSDIDIRRSLLKKLCFTVAQVYHQKKVVNSWAT
jgi:hypothetical protein